MMWIAGPSEDKNTKDRAKHNLDHLKPMKNPNKQMSTWFPARLCHSHFAYLI